MSLFRRKKKQKEHETVDRRKPGAANAERRRFYEELNAQARLAEKQLVEHRLADADKRAEELNPRLEYLRAVARTISR